MLAVKKSRQLFDLGDVNTANVLQLRVLNTATLPVRYSDKFYRELLENYTNKYMKYAFWNGFVVGGICARVENDADSNYGPDAKDQHDTDDNGKSSDKSIVNKKGRSRLYIMTLNVLAPYRRYGIGEYYYSEVIDFSFILFL